MPFKISRLGGTSLRRSFITNVYWAVMVRGGYTRAALRRLHVNRPTTRASTRTGHVGRAARARPEVWAASRTCIVPHHDEAPELFAWSGGHRCRCDAAASRACSGEPQ